MLRREGAQYNGDFNGELIWHCCAQRSRIALSLLIGAPNHILIRAANLTVKLGRGESGRR
jgi:hypothetical protein